MNDPKYSHLLDQLAQDDELAMKSIFQEFYQGVYLTINRFVKQREISQDLAQEVFVKLWRKRHDLLIRDSLKGYLSMMSYHETMAYLRKPRPIQVEPVLVEHVLPSTDGNHEVAKLELQEQIDRVVKKLPPRCKTAFILSRFEGKSYKEIAAIMEISTKTVEHQMSKALKTLRVELSEYLPICLLIGWLI